MSKKFSFIFSLLVFAILFSFIGCTDLLAPKAQTDINLKIDLSKIIKSSRNEGDSQGASSLGDNPTIKVAIYDAKDYDKATNSTENLTLITQAQASVGGDGIARVKLSDIPVGIDAIVFAELSFTDENSTQVVYAGNSGVFKVKASDNKVSLVLKKVGNSEIYPDDTNTPYENYTLYKKTENGEEEVSNNTEAYISTSSTMETKVTVKNPEMSESVWTYFVKPENKTRFTKNGNYKVSVELKADKTTVVGIAAARADYFFTVNNDWTTCEFNTGYLIGNEKHQFTIGLGLSSEIQIKNLKIEKLSEIDTTEPSLVFDISRHAIETYLGKIDKATKIIDVEKVEDDSGMATAYNITINAPLTNNDSVQNVKLHLRDYAKSVGVNNVSFEVKNTGENPFATSFMADTASNNSKAWNNVRTEVVYSNYDSCNIDFPNYTANDELTVDVITGSSVAYPNYPVEFTISKFKVEEPVATSTPFANKFFAIKTGATWTQGKSVEVTIPVNGNKEFDVGMFNSWDYSKNMPSSFDDVTRFFYTGSKQISEKLAYSYNDNPNDPIFTITNNSGEDKIVKISLNENYEVVIEEVTGTTITSWDNLKSQIKNLTNSNTATEFVIANNLTATETITVTKPVKITALDNVTISRVDSFTGNFFNVSSGGSLELAGSENSTITLDGGYSNSSSITAQSPLITVNGKLTLSNCTLQNNTNNASQNAFGGAVYVNGGTLNFSSGTIQNCIAGDAGAVYLTSANFTMTNVKITGCSVTLSGGAIWMTNSSSFIMDGGEISNCKTTGNKGGALYITGTGCSALMKGTAKITGCQSTNTAAGGINLGGGTFTMTDNSCISGCSAKTNGNGIYINGGTFNISGNAYVDSTNDVYFSDNTSNIINISGVLTKEEVAKISLSKYIEGKKILSADGVDLAQQVRKFTLSNEEYCIDSNGMIAINYAQGLTYIGSSTDDPGTLYISSAEGLATFRDIVNGSFTEKIIVRYQDNSNSTHTFSDEVSNIDAVLVNDITISDEWTPIGKYANDTSKKPYSGTFDGDGKTVTFDNITHSSTEMYSSGLFQMVSGSVKNLVIDGSISRTVTGYIGGVVGYLDGGTIENCVNKAIISNEATNGTGGIVGYVANSTATIKNCVNMAKVESTQSTVGGIVGATGVISGTSNVSISKCINMGEISALSNVAGILGFAYPITIENCINLGKIVSTRTDDVASYAAGIVIPSDNQIVTVTNCINAGNVVTCNNYSVGAISTSENGTYTNNYYDSKINSNVLESDIDGIEVKSTSELIGSNLSLEGISDGQWTFADNRYPLPNIAENIPDDENDEIWNAVLEAATPDSSSTSGGE